MKNLAHSLSINDVSAAANWRASSGVVWMVRALICLGLACLVFFFSWWWQDGRLASPVLWLMLIAAAIYTGTQMVSNWVLYLFAHRSTPFLPPSREFTVDVFVTAYHEPLDMVARSLVAACQMQGEHRTWLLDDGRNPQFAELAERLGAGYLTRPGNVDAKAGNLNAALARTHGDIIAIFDIDHVPEPDFLSSSLGPFNDPKIGFVQVMVTFANGAESWVARAATETSLEYYNPTSIGGGVIGGSTLMGTNALIRRSALESIGGYRPGLAEDLATSIALNAAGWKSAYIAEPLAPGIAPPSYHAWFTQQLKWARGVFELLVTVYPRVIRKLTWGQNFAYLVRMTRYWVGPAVAFHLAATILIMIVGDSAWQRAFHDYLNHLTPLIVADMLIRRQAYANYRHPLALHSVMWRAVLLVYATWPVYLLAWMLALLRAPVAFKPTPKTTDGHLRPIWLLPQILALLLLLGGMGITVFVAGQPISLLLLFASLQAALQLDLLFRWTISDRLSRPVKAPAG